MIKQILTTFRFYEWGSRFRIAISASILGSMAALAVMGACTEFSNSPVAVTADDVAKKFCVSPPLDALVRPEDNPDREARVPVPADITDHNSNGASLAARKGDVVKLTVSSQHAGAVGVHGLSTIDAIHPGKSVVIKFRAIYSGRFPLHFHGTDGSHFELMSINISADADANTQN